MKTQGWWENYLAEDDKESIFNTEKEEEPEEGHSEPEQTLHIDKTFTVYQTKFGKKY